MAANELVRWDEIPGRRVEVGPMCATWTDLGKAGGSVATGLKRIQIEPGRRSTPVHAHDAEEEIFYVLAGDGLSWQDGETCEVMAGHCIVQVAAGAAHTLIAGAKGLDVLAFGTRRAAPVTRLPRAGVAWIGQGWVEIAGEPHPWGREAAAGELVVPEPGERPANVVSGVAVEEVVIAHGDTHRKERALGRAGGSRATGLNRVFVAPNRLNCPPHVHAAEEEIFVVLDGEGILMLYDCDTRPQAPPRLKPVRTGDLLVRPAGSGIAHAFLANALGLTLLAYGERRSDEMTYYPRSGKVRFRGLGVTGRLELCGYWDGESPEA
ncbi:MAG: cupin domain-containing protein [Actinobacteria bacterium]|nr:cupin domain-containing protein [Actinomycetota bacterium]